MFDADEGFVWMLIVMLRVLDNELSCCQNLLSSCAFFPFAAALVLRYGGGYKFGKEKRYWEHGMSNEAQGHVIEH